MDATVSASPVKPAQRQPVCGACWSQVNWCESFDRFGHGDGEDCIHTASVVHALRIAGYHAKCSDDSCHNTLVEEVGYLMSDGTVKVVFAEDLPTGNRIGYSDPRVMLPLDIVEFLDNSFGIGEFFG